MRDFDAAQEQRFFDIFKKYYDLEKDAGKQHNPENYSLDRMYPLAELVGNPEKQFKITSDDKFFDENKLVYCFLRNGEEEPAVVNKGSYGSLDDQE